MLSHFKHNELLRAGSKGNQPPLQFGKPLLCLGKPCLKGKELLLRHAGHQYHITVAIHTQHTAAGVELPPTSVVLVVLKVRAVLPRAWGVVV